MEIWIEFKYGYREWERFYPNEDSLRKAKIEVLSQMKQDESGDKMFTYRIVCEYKKRVIHKTKKTIKWVKKEQKNGV